MKIRLFTFIALAGLLLSGTSCANSKKAKTENKDMTTENTTSPEGFLPDYSVDFMASGEDGNWKFAVKFDEEIAFVDKKNKINFHTTEVHTEVAAGANVINVWAENAVYAVQATIDIVDCGRNGKEVNIMVRKKHNKKEYDYEACGIYRGKPQLHDIWALESINGRDFSPELFPREHPHFEFDLAQQKMSGFAGCNQVGGNIRFEYKKIIFDPLISTRMYCQGASDIENEIMKVLNSQPTYDIKELRLYIESPEGSIILRKVD